MLSSRDQGYLQALESARAEFLAADSAERCRAAGAGWEERGKTGLVRLPFFQDTCEISMPEFSFALVPGREQVSLGNQVLILHYLNRVSDIPLTGRCISFKDVPTGEFYFPAFARRSIQPLLRTFAEAPAAFVAAGRRLGGCPINEGDAGITLRVFPRVPVTLLLWAGDEELSADLSMLFDAALPQWLESEDIAVIGQEIMVRMIRTHQRGTEKGAGNG